MSKPTPTQRILQSHLDRPLLKRVMKARAQEQSWEQVAQELARDTGERVTRESLRNWFYEEDEARKRKTAAAKANNIAQAAS